MDSRFKKYFGTQIDKIDDNRFSKWVNEDDYYGLEILEKWILDFKRADIYSELGMDPMRPQVAIYAEGRGKSVDDKEEYEDE